MPIVRRCKGAAVNADSLHDQSSMRGFFFDAR
jgi:hypothetical protein